MATNPNLTPPERRQPERPQPELIEVEKRSRFPWPLIALLATAAILAAIIYALPRTPKATPGAAAGQVPDQPFGSQVQMKGLRVAESPVGGQTYIYGEMTNTGGSSIYQVTVDSAFTDGSGQPIQRETRNAEFLSDSKGASAAAAGPLKAGQTMPFRVGFDAIPTGWNHQVPAMRIVHVATSASNVVPAGEAGGEVLNPPQTGGATQAAGANQTPAGATAKPNGGTVSPGGTTANPGGGQATAPAQKPPR